MQKKILKITGLIAFVGFALVNIANSRTEKIESDVLLGLIEVSEANAECNGSQNNNGRCGSNDICFWGRGSSEDFDCDTTL